MSSLMPNQLSPAHPALTRHYPFNRRCHKGNLEENAESTPSTSRLLHPLRVPYGSHEPPPIVCVLICVHATFSCLVRVPSPTLESQAFLNMSGMCLSNQLSSCFIRCDGVWTITEEASDNVNLPEGARCFFLWTRMVVGWILTAGNGDGGIVEGKM